MTPSLPTFFGLFGLKCFSWVSIARVSSQEEDPPRVQGEILEKLKNMINVFVRVDSSLCTRASEQFQKCFVWQV